MTKKSPSGARFAEVYPDFYKLAVDLKTALEKEGLQSWQKIPKAG